MVRIAAILLITVSCFNISLSQQFEAKRITDWSKAGISQQLATPTNLKTILDFGGDNTGATNCNEAFELAMASLEGSAGTIYFPEGEYFFNSPLVLQDSVFIKGAGPHTKLKFDLGNNSNLIQVAGTILPTEYELAEEAFRGSFNLNLADASAFEMGDFLRLYMDDQDLMHSSWAYGTLGQVVEVVDVNENQLTLADPLNHNYPLNRNPKVKEVDPISAVAIECLYIEREDDSDTQNSNIYFNAANNCMVRNIESNRCDFGHVEINSSTHITVERNYFHHAIGYGGGGKGYGVIFQMASSFCLAQNNIFEHLRHSMLIQAGANGNVFAYNYSTDPFWETSGLPSNSAGDAVLHGNYAYLNLFEGNTVQNMVIDASHGKNGPYNTFFRNRGELFGFFSDPSTPTDSMNVVGNEITQSGFPYGLFMLNGNGHYSYGNNVNETTTPTGTHELELQSLYLNSLDAQEFLEENTLPMVGYPLSLNEKMLPAQHRFETGTPISCNEEVITTINDDSNVEEPLLSVWGKELQINHDMLPARVSIYSFSGQLIDFQTTDLQHLQLNKLSVNAGYIINVVGSNKKISSIKFVYTN